MPDLDRSPRAFPLRRIAVAAAPAILLGFLLVHAAERGLSDVYGRLAYSRIESWDKARKPVPSDDWTDTRDWAQTAERLTPRSPDTAETLGRLYDWGAASKEPAISAVVAYRQQALKHFREAAQRRPTSGYTWASIARQKAALAQIDAEFAKALELAALLGPWEPDVQFTIVDAGLARWTRLDKASQEIVRQAAARGLNRHAKEILEIAKRRGRSAIVCPLGAIPPALSGACK